MTIAEKIAARIQNAPFGEDTEHRRLDLSTSPASIALAPGGYEVSNPGTVTAYLRIGAAVSIPASGAAAVTGQFEVPPGGAAVFVVGGGATVTVHGLTASGTTTINLYRKVTS